MLPPTPWFHSTLYYPYYNLTHSLASPAPPGPDAQRSPAPGTGIPRCKLDKIPSSTGSRYWHPSAVTVPPLLGQSPQLQSRHNWCPWRSRQCFVVTAVKCMARDKEEELGRNIPRHKVHTVCLRQVITIQTQTSTMPGHWELPVQLAWGKTSHTPVPT